MTDCLGDNADCCTESKNGEHEVTSDKLSKSSLAMRKRILAEMICDFPLHIKNRLRALKNLQLSFIKSECDFYKELHVLENKYLQKYIPLFDKRADIISGKYEPTEEECEWKLEEESENIGKLRQLQIGEGEVLPPKISVLPEDAPGIPDFWLTIFKNSVVLADIVKEDDEPALKYLQDVKIKQLMSDPIGFILEFHFAANPFFKNAILTKEYHLKLAPPDDDPFSYDGPYTYNSIGFDIDWHEGQDLTVKLEKKKSKTADSGKVVQQVKNESFFNFFSPPASTEKATEEDEEAQDLVTEDYELGHYFRECIIPRAVLYYTGEGLVDEGDSEEEIDEDDGDEEEDDESESEN